MVRYTAAFALAALGCLANADIVKYKVRIRNLTYMQPFSPPLIAAHTKSDISKRGKFYSCLALSVFQEGKPAIDAVKLMAEDGDNSALLAFADDPFVMENACGVVVADGPLLPGKTWRGTLEVDTDICKDPVYSVVGMLVNTNDAFVGVDSEKLPYYGASKVFPPAFDAGTEMNNELCSHIPGPACTTESGNQEATPGEGYIHVHRGVHGIGDITADVYDWRNPVAEIFIEASG